MKKLEILKISFFSLFSIMKEGYAMEKEDISSGENISCDISKHPQSLSKKGENLKPILPQGNLHFDEELGMYYYGKKFSEIAHPQYLLQPFLSNEDIVVYSLADNVIEASSLVSKNSLKVDDNWQLKEGWERREDSHLYPWSAHGRLLLDYGGGSKYIGSGVLIGDRYVLTAAHNFLHPLQNGHAPVKIVFYTGVKGNDVLSATAADKIAIHPKWYENYLSTKEEVSKAREAADLAVIKLKFPIESTSNFFDVRAVDNEELLRNRKVNVTGYSASENGKYLYTIKCDIEKIEEGRLFYKATTCPGQSGGAIWLECNFTREDGVHFCIAIHGYGKDVNGGCRGALLNGEKTAKIRKWIDYFSNEDPPLLKFQPILKEEGKNKIVVAIQATVPSKKSGSFSPAEVIDFWFNKYNPNLGLVNDPSVYPWCIFGQVEAKYKKGNISIGSGILIGRSYVLTAGHMLYNLRSKEFASKVTFYNKSVKLENANESEADKLIIHPHYLQYENEGMDLGLISLIKPLGQKLGYASLNALSDHQLTTNKINITGYAYQDYLQKELKMHTMNGSIEKVNPQKIYYDMKTNPGMSGSPVWVYDQEGKQCNVVAIHAYSPDSNFNLRSGVRLTSKKIALLHKWMTDLDLKKNKEEDFQGLNKSLPLSNLSFNKSLALEKLDVSQPVRVNYKEGKPSDMPGLHDEYRVEPAIFDLNNFFHAIFTKEGKGLSWVTEFSTKCRKHLKRIIPKTPRYSNIMREELLLQKKRSKEEVSVEKVTKKISKKEIREYVSQHEDKPIQLLKNERLSSFAKIIADSEDILIHCFGYDSDHKELNYKGSLGQREPSNGIASILWHNECYWNLYNSQESEDRYKRITQAAENWKIWQAQRTQGSSSS